MYILALKNKSIKQTSEQSDKQTLLSNFQIFICVNKAWSAIWGNKIGCT